MLQAIKSIFSSKEPVDYKEVLDRGGIIVDVRTKGEYQGGHIKGSKNMPLQSFQNSHTKLNKSNPIIVCCASGARSGSAKRMLESNGFEEVYNGGGWQMLNFKLQD